MSLNTLEMARRIQAAERDGRAAEEIALILKELQDTQLDRLVTKEFLHGEINRLDNKIELLRGELERRIQFLRADMEKMELRLTNSLTARMGAPLAAAVAVLGGLNIFF